MAHILKEFAKSCNVEPSKPKLAEHFFPIALDKYIILSCSASEKSMQYKYWQEVFKLISLPLELNGIDIVQLTNGNENVIPEADLTLGVLTPQQKAYVIKKAILVAGASGISCHMASAYNVKTVSLHSKYFVENNRPYWPNADISIQPTTKDKPSFSNEDPLNRINRIKPEEIAKAILENLNISQEINHNSIHIGKHYPSQVSEICPNFFDPIIMPKDHAVNIRLDWHHDLNLASQWIQGRKVNLFSDKKIDKNFLLAFKNNINLINVFIDQATDINYLRELQTTGVKCIFYTKDIKNIKSIRLKFIDWTVEEYRPPSKKDLDNYKELCNNEYYYSSKIILSDNKVFDNRAAMKRGIVRVEEGSKVIDCDEFWEDLSHLYIFNKQHA